MHEFLLWLRDLYNQQTDKQKIAALSLLGLCVIGVCLFAGNFFSGNMFAGRAGDQDAMNVYVELPRTLLNEQEDFTALIQLDPKSSRLDKLASFEALIEIGQTASLDHVSFLSGMTVPNNGVYSFVTQTGSFVKVSAVVDPKVWSGNVLTRPTTLATLHLRTQSVLQATTGSVLLLPGTRVFAYSENRAVRATVDLSSSVLQKDTQHTDEYTIANNLTSSTPVVSTAVQQPVEFLSSISHSGSICFTVSDGVSTAGTWYVVAQNISTQTLWTQSGAYTLTPSPRGGYETNQCLPFTDIAATFSGVTSLQIAAKNTEDALSAFVALTPRWNHQPVLDITQQHVTYLDPYNLQAPRLSLATGSVAFFGRDADIQDALTYDLTASGAQVQKTATGFDLSAPQSSGSYMLTYSLSDGKETVSRTGSWLVQFMNPVIRLAGGKTVFDTLTIPAGSASVDWAYLQAFDLQWGTGLTVTLTPNTGATVTGQKVTFTQTGQYIVTARAQSPADATQVSTFTGSLTVVKELMTPAVLAPSALTPTLTLSGGKAILDVSQLPLNQADTVVIVSHSGGTLSGSTLTYTTPGTYTVVVEVSDSTHPERPKTQQTITVTILPEPTSGGQSGGGSTTGSSSGTTTSTSSGGTTTGGSTSGGSSGGGTSGGGTSGGGTSGGSSGGGSGGNGTPYYNNNGGTTTPPQTAGGGAVSSSQTTTNSNNTTTSNTNNNTTVSSGGQDGYGQVATAIKSGDLTKAETLARAMVESNPMDARGWSALGWALLEQGKYTEAQSALERAWELDPTFPNTALNLGLLYEKLEKWNDAIKWFEKAIELAGPDSWITRMAQEHINAIRERLRRLAQPRPQRTLIQKIQNIFTPTTQTQTPQTATASVISADEYARQIIDAMAQKDAQKALLLARQAVTAYPDNALLWTLYGWVLLENQRYDESLQALKRAETLDPYNQRLWLNFGDLYRLLQRYDDARHAYEMCVQFGNTAWMTTYCQTQKDALASSQPVVQDDFFAVLWKMFVRMVRSLFGLGA